MSRAEVDADLDQLAVWAVRYTLGRQTYAPHIVTETLARCWPRLSAVTRERIVIDIDRAVGEARCGADFDCEAWRRAADTLRGGARPEGAGG